MRVKRREDVSCGFQIDFRQFMKHLFSKFRNLSMLFEDDDEQLQNLKKALFPIFKLILQDFLRDVTRNSSLNLTGRHVQSLFSRPKFLLLNFANHHLCKSSFIQAFFSIILSEFLSRFGNRVHFFFNNKVLCD